MSIAVLDDDKLQLKIMDDILSRNQIYNVDFYHNPRDLLKVNKDYDVYLIDLILPEVDGEIVMLEMRKRSENAVIIGISSIEKNLQLQEFFLLGQTTISTSQSMNRSLWQSYIQTFGF